MARPKREQTAQTAVRAANMVKFREARGMSQSDASRFAGVDKSNLYLAEKDKTTPSNDNLAALARIYGHRLDDFYEKKPPPMDPSLVPAFVLLEPGVDIDPGMLAKARAFIEKLNDDHAQALRERAKKQR